MPSDTLYLFGGDQPWDASCWTASDDRVRGGSSTSFLTVTSPESARFHGHLDTTTLGGAGFASQRTVGELELDLSAYQGLSLSLEGGASGHKFTLTIKDTIPGDRGDGRDQAGVSWEADFEPPAEGGDIELPWGKFRATYRGRDLKDPKPLDLKSIKRVSLMMRSFFGSQDGDFELIICAIAAKNFTHEDGNADRTGNGEEAEEEAEEEEEEEEDADDLQKPPVHDAPRQEDESRRVRSWWRMLFCGLV
ncbi:complex I intermediate-associated protein 30-domain-containing protein [Mariannaea sp. PMI_226]|nr:complex I intermediate-associated protein 30-domain-containing protein [Mariannaea sp. PMI_226]